ncbi:aminotransferase class I/II-fold pyridoxal phosphate-dependent enzyme [Pseudemcibacter aquimaris]|uniref:aminotransferase class I/II-fold pyridoxal phosphate-dependent enzyme n=1 Tax=Pseudemcibacter aquimaris TaxID=2857064 RepID=UPI00201361EF|nr:aminotransferase class I/II-fold pyridoxal phosphate-dependent enzyme [Pseudemcibacter aquimaris]MCC3862415.1 aminotransferase class I/II-fold pyridoxal phosphate-dependent enzyme [Pseudemcibacter aquimaris]WDU59155.1 aminotransferase class I/II-fold pyridoxal phosphate-dependent enzyme [Pseudemcibacter aquimaris]
MRNSSRRGFMKTAGMTALLSSMGTHKAFSQGTSNKQSTSRHNFDEHFNRIGHNSDKWDLIIQQYGREKIKASMGVADMDFRQFSEVNSALRERTKYENYGYEMVPDSYYQSIINWNEQRYGQSIKKEWIKNSATLLPSITASLVGLNPHKGKVIIQTPTYSGFWGAIKRAGMTRVEVPLKQNNGKFSMDLAAVERAFDDDTKCLIICNPNNPTGTAWSADELKALGDLCIKHGVTVLSDEIHCDFIRKDKKFTPYSSLGEKYANTSITYRSSSKTFSQSSLCVAHFFTQNEDLMRATMKTHRTACNTYGLLACEVA